MRGSQRADYRVIGLAPALVFATQLRRLASRVALTTLDIDAVLNDA